jgi:hypothetical protein
MNGKQLKEFAAKCGDDAVIQVREKGYVSWSGKFTIQAIIGCEAEEEKEEGAEVSQFIDDRRRAAEREQQRLIDAANAKQAELDRKAQELKDEEDRLRLAAEQAESPEEMYHGLGNSPFKPLSDVRPRKKRSR